VHVELWSLLIVLGAVVLWPHLNVRIQLLRTRLVAEPTAPASSEELETLRTYFDGVLADTGLILREVCARQHTTLVYSTDDRCHVAGVGLGLVVTLTFISRRRDGTTVITAAGPGEPPFPLPGLVRRVSVDPSPARAFAEHVAFVGSAQPIAPGGESHAPSLDFDTWFFEGSVSSGFARRDGDAYVLTLSGAHEWAKTLGRAGPASVATATHPWRVSVPPFPESLLLELHARFREQSRVPLPSRYAWSIGIATATVFAVVALVAWPWQVALSLVGVVVLHELGHAVAMLATGHRDVRVLFLPLVGAVTQGQRTRASLVADAVVLLAGPMPGLLLGLALLPSESPGLQTFGRVAFVLNALNLLPVLPFDGGRLVALTLPSRTWIEALLAGASVLGLVALAYFFESPLFAFVAFTVVLTAYTRIRHVVPLLARHRSLLREVATTVERRVVLHRAVRASFSQPLAAVGVVDLLEDAAERAAEPLPTRFAIVATFVCCLGLVALPWFLWW